MLFDLRKSSESKAIQSAQHIKLGIYAATLKVKQRMQRHEKLSRNVEEFTCLYMFLPKKKLQEILSCGFQGDREAIRWEDQEYNKNVSAFYKKYFLFERQQGKELSG